MQVWYTLNDYRNKCLMSQYRNIEKAGWPREAKWKCVICILCLWRNEALISNMCCWHSLHTNILSWLMRRNSGFYYRNSEEKTMKRRSLLETLSYEQSRRPGRLRRLELATVQCSIFQRGWKPWNIVEKERRERNSVQWKLSSAMKWLYLSEKAMKINACMKCSGLYNLVESLWEIYIQSLEENEKMKWREASVSMWRNGLHLQTLYIQWEKLCATNESVSMS